MDGRVGVYVYGADPVFQVGIASLLRGLRDVSVLCDGEIDTAAVALVVTDDVDDETVKTVRAIQRNGCPKVIVVAGHLDHRGVMAAIEGGACGFLRRREASPDPGLEGKGCALRTRNEDCTPAPSRIWGTSDLVPRRAG